jgi:hypothetical protein
MGTTVFTWESAMLNPWDIDRTLYTLKFVLQGSQDSLVFGPTLDTTYSIPGDSILQWVDRSQRRIILWWVSCVDTADQRVWSSSGPRKLIIPSLGVREAGVTSPDQFFINVGYPNPFNACTMLKYGLPESSDLDISVWDTYGRLVSQLVSGHYEAGNYHVEWRANNIPSGVYFIKMQAGSFIGIQKMVLVK